jgi:hypothetical protein
MGMGPDQLGQVRRQVIEAVRRLRVEILWKPGKDVQHLRTRIRYGHLLEDATLADYHAIIRGIVKSGEAEVYIYVWHTDIYPTVVGLVDGQRWLVMFSVAGVMETAFPPTDPIQYLADPRFQYIGTLQELEDDRLS